MTLTDIQSALRHSPFVPFDILTENGRVVRVPHPDFLLLEADQTTALIAEGDRFVVVDVRQIQALRFRIARP